MAEVASTTIWTFYGPRLLRIMRRGDVAGYNYQPNFLESFSDRIVYTIRAALSATYWCSPVVIVMLYRRGYCNVEGIQGLSKIALSLFAVYALAFLFRGIGRLSNADYRNFMATFVQARNNPCQRTREQLAGYDFEFWGWPVDYKWSPSGADGDKKRRQRNVAANRKSQNQTSQSSSLTVKILGYLAMHSFGQKMIYPGSTSLMNFIVSSMLNQGRANLIEEKNGKRAKIQTEDNNELDTVFVDRRGQHRNGEILVIASEGNAGFYEMGCSGTPIELSYSVLGWNRPGFGGSTGTPWPDSEEKAVEAVVMYAINKLGFEPRNIAVFAWSIGGYSGALMARNFPDIKFVVLDATFDDLVPLAISKMPSSWSNLVTQSVRTYMDLNIAEKLLDYQGPILLIRRTRDEMISTSVPNDSHPDLSTNRGNDLLLKVLQFRYPTIVDNTTLPVMKRFLSLQTFRQVQMLQEKDVEYEVCNELVTQHVAQNGPHFPMNISVDQPGLKEKLSLFLITMHMDNFESTHNAPLPGKFFRKPWIPGARL
ncbi:hypothetical protein EGW08_005156 [Elysia chlorotica]|uniref:Uncharacterized protein n=1 Tax=Elysia chlorotica TaxID=188477 RepID=A0A433TZV0_ELYCH|nr:hypothetical protein EGW08_005156 [Elysia chlorotica]